MREPEKSEMVVAMLMAFTIVVIAIITELVV
jgi:hypothetical protein